MSSCSVLEREQICRTRARQRSNQRDVSVSVPRSAFMGYFSSVSSSFASKIVISSRKLWLMERGQRRADANGLQVAPCERPKRPKRPKQRPKQGPKSGFETFVWSKADASKNEEPADANEPRSLASLAANASARHALLLNRETQSVGSEME